MLNAHFMRRTKNFPPLMRAREALDEIQTKVHSAPRATNEQMELVQQAINCAYTPSVTGAEMHFYACETDQHRSRHLGIDPISDTIIMTAALQAFSVEHHGEQLQHIAESWAIINSATNFLQDEYEGFKDHYNRWLADLYNPNCNAPSAANNQAHPVIDALAEHNNRLFVLETE